MNGNDGSPEKRRQTEESGYKALGNTQVISSTSLLGIKTEDNIPDGSDEVSDCYEHICKCQKPQQLSNFVFYEFLDLEMCH